MRYKIPAGTTVDVRRIGQRRFQPHTTRKTLHFDKPQTVAYGGKVYYFEYQRWLISVRAERVIDEGRRT